MADQTRKPKPREDEQVEAGEETKAEAQTDEVDDLLDEIDEVLEANAEEFVRSYVQKGGE
jgi:ubiquitin-like protein Pup